MGSADIPQISFQRESEFRSRAVLSGLYRPQYSSQVVFIVVGHLKGTLSLESDRSNLLLELCGAALVGVSGSSK